MRPVLATALLLLTALPALAEGTAAHSGPPAFLGQLTLLLLVSAAAAYLSFRVGLVPIIGFLLAGVLAGPSALGLIRDPQLISDASEIGVMLLLFTIGIEFSLDRLARIARLIFLGGGLQVILTVVLTALVLMAFHVTLPNGVFTGCLIALSSTAIVLKLLSARGGNGTPAAQVSLGILIFQDLAVVVMVLLIPMLAGQGGGLGGVLVALLKAGGIIALVLVAARRLVPPLLEAVARTCSTEIFLLTVVALCFGTAYLTALAGVSLALGAFLAGLLVSESRYGTQALGEILPLQVLFSAAFFLSVGLQLDLRFLATHLPLVLGVGILIVLLKVTVTGVSVRLLRESPGTSIYVALLLAQVGEFSFVLATTGQALGLSFAGLGTSGTQVFIAATVLLMAFTPLLAGAGATLAARKSAARPTALPTGTPDVGDAPGEGMDVRGRVVFAGYGAHARLAARALSRAGQTYAVVTRNPDGASELELRGVPVLIADYTRVSVLTDLNIAAARALVVVDDDEDLTHRAVSVTRTVAPDLPVIAFARTVSERQVLQALNTTHILSAHKEVAAGLLDLLTPDAVSRSDLRRHMSDLPSVMLTDDQQAQCEHAHATPGPTIPEADVCLECLATGDTWVHLRVCMTCGHVGCCDSSKHRHATRHATTQAHPVIRSAEPGETWAYCYEHRWTK